LAAALGVSFEEVAGATATLTKSGVPTSVAMTQIRSSMVALQKPNKDMVDLLEAAGFESGQAALESGDLASVLDTLRGASEESGVSMEMAFGSVEALGAVLALTGENAEGAAADFQAMQNASGATGEAFGRMEQGIGPVIDKFMAWKETMLITIGDALAPFAGKLLEMAQDILPAVEKVITGVTGALFGSEQAFGETTFHIAGIVEKIQALIESGGSLAEFFTVFEDGSTNLDRLLQAFGMNEEKAQALGATISKVTLAIIDIKDRVLEFLEPVIEWIQENVKLEDILTALGIVIAAVVIPAIISIVSALAPVVAAVAGLILVVTLLRDAWEEDWGGIRTFLTNAWNNNIKPALEQLWQWLQINIPIAIETLKDFWENVLLPAIQDVWNWISTVLIPFFQDVVVPWLQEKIPAAIQALSDFWTNTLLPAINDVWTFIQNDLVPLFQTLWELIQVAGGLAIEIISGAWENILKPALETVWEFIQDNVIPILEDLWDFISETLQPVIETITEKFDTMTEGIGGVSGAVQWLIEKIEALIEWLKRIEIPGVLLGESPSPFETSLRGIADAMKEVNALQLPAIQSNVNGGGMSSISTPMAGQTVHYHLNVQSGQSGGRIVQDFDLMKAVSGG
jgi:hypothetical protein